MATAQEARTQYLIVAIAMVGVFTVATASIYYFYGLNGRATLYPYKTLSQQAVVILRVALVAGIISLWPVWLSVRRKRKAGTEALTSALGVLIVLALYGLAGCGGVLGGSIRIAGWQISTRFFFPSHFFYEFNFLTFICEVAPVTATFAGVIVYSMLKWAPFREGS